MLFSVPVTSLLYTILFSVILSVDDEVEYWQNLSTNTKSNEKRKAILSFIEILKPLAKEFRF